MFKKLKKNSNLKKRKWIRIFCISLTGITVAGSIATIVTTTSNNNGNNYTFDMSKNTNSTQNESSLHQYHQVVKVINDFIKHAKLNQNSINFESQFNQEINQMVSSKAYLSSLLKHSINDNQYNELCTLAKELKKQYSPNVSLTKNLMSISEIKKIQRNISNDFINLNSNLMSFSSTKENSERTIWNVMGDLQSLSTQLTTQKNALSGTGTGVAIFLGFLSFVDLGTTAAIAIAVADVFAFICNGLGSAINTINNSLTNIREIVNENYNSLNTASTLNQTAQGINACINSLQSAKSKLQNDTWIIGVNKAINQLNTAINELQNAYRELTNEINQLD